MASLKEIRARISSVSSTQKLTSAMKMVSAAKLHKSEEATLKFVPYKNKLSDMLSQYLSSVFLLAQVCVAHSTLILISY